jgi:hypothetical protein
MTKQTIIDSNSPTRIGLRYYLRIPPDLEELFVYCSSVVWKEGDDGKITVTTFDFPMGDP